MKRVLLTVHKFFPDHRAGTELLTLKVAQELKRRGYQVTILTMDPPDLDARRKRYADNSELINYEYEDITVYCLKEQARLKEDRFSNEYYHPYLRKHYKKIFDIVTPDIVHCFHLQNLSASLLDEAYARKIPVIYSATDFWLICPIVQLRRPDGSNCSGPTAFGINCLSCYTPKLMPVRAEFEEALTNKYPKLKEKIENLSRRIAKAVFGVTYFAYLQKKLPSAMQATMTRPAVLKKFANKLSAITVPTRLMQDLFIRNGLNKNIIHHVPYGIDTRLSEKGCYKLESDELRIAFIGTLAEHKGPDLLIKAFLQLPTDIKASLTLYGAPKQFPEYFKYLEKLVETGSCLAKKITFAGTFPNDQIGEIFRQIDVLVVPSRWYENTPLVIQSALAAKTPVIAANLGGMAELITHNGNGLLFEPDNVKALQEQLSQLIDKPNLLKNLVENIKPERSVAEMVNSLEKLYCI